MMRTAGGYLLAVISMILVLGIGCSGPPSEKAEASSGFTDQLGRVVKIEKPPQRIISLAPSNTEILFALGLGDRVVGVTDYETYPPEAKQKPSIGGFSTPSIEKIVALSPDLVLAAPIHEKSVIPRLEERGLTVFALAPKTIDQIADSIILAGKITGEENTASKIAADMRAKIKAIVDKTSSLTEAQRPSVFFVVWHDPLMAAGSGTFHDELIRKAGGTNMARDLSGYAGISLEAVVAANPRVMLAGVGMGDGADATYKFAMTEPRLKDTDARRNNRVYSLDVDLVGHAGPRITQALQLFAEFIHPEIFKAR